MHNPQERVLRVEKRFALGGAGRRGAGAPWCLCEVVNRERGKEAGNL